jgi:hypothetical protein
MLKRDVFMKLICTNHENPFNTSDFGFVSSILDDFLQLL